AGSLRAIDDDDPSVEFARIAWRIATGPVMAPPLVRCHPRVLGARVGRSGWSDEMLADIRLACPRPQPLEVAATVGGVYWRAHRRTWDDAFAGVGEDDLVGDAYLLTEVRLLWQLPVGTLPVIGEVPTSIRALFGAAVECLTVLVGALNRDVGPVIAR